MLRRLLVLLLCGPLLAVAQEPKAAVPAALQPYVESHTLAGAVTLVLNKEKVLSLEAVGSGDIAANKPMATDALFWIAALSKPLTATALMMLVDEGKLSVDDPVEKYLPEFKNQWVLGEKTEAQRTLLRPLHPILIRNLLTHTSGLPFRSVVEQPTLDLLPLRTAVLSYTAEPLAAQPDAQFLYSNAGFNTIGRLIEVVSRMPYERFMQQRLFDPLGMHDTTFLPNAAQLARLPKVYKPTADKLNLQESKIAFLFYPLSDPRRQPVPSGGLFSTAADLGRFCQMILNGGEWEGKRYVSQKSWAQMTTRQTAPEVKKSYGFGWSMHGKSFGHAGAFSTTINIDPAQGLATIFLVQQDGWPNQAGNKVYEAFLKAALAEYGPK